LNHQHKLFSLAGSLADSQDHQIPKKTTIPVTVAVTGIRVELLGGFEPPTSSLPTQTGNFF
jgi:hypothetical protein